MSFADIAGGAACGPSNPLQTLGKRFGQDRSTQFDRFGGNAGSSSSGPRSGFRASPHSQPPQQEGFQHQPPSFDLAPLSRALPLQHTHQPTHFAPNVTSANFEASFQQPQPQANLARGGSPWSGDFLNASSSSRSMTPQAQEASTQLHATPTSASQHRGYNSYQPRFASSMMPMSHMNSVSANHLQHSQATQQMHQPAQSHADDKTWNDAFTAYDATQQPQPMQQIVQDTLAQHPEMTPYEADELAKTAGRLVSTVEHDQNDKFKQSRFLDLMRKLRDSQATVEGTDIVERTDGAQEAPRLDKGKGRAMDTGPRGVENLAPPRTEREAYERMRNAQGTNNLQLPLGSQIDTQQAEAEGRDWLNEIWQEEDARSAAIEEKVRQENAARQQQSFVGDSGDLSARQREDDLEAREFARFQGLRTGVPGAQSRLQSQWEEDMDEASKEDFVGRRWEGTKGRGVPGAQEAEWAKLQDDWEAFEAGPNGVRSTSHERRQQEQPFTAANVPRYQFQEDNPYLQTTRQHAMHASSHMPDEIRSILESEAAVQQDPTDSQAWFNLGVKQQENERETSAIAALHRAIQINPLMKEAWLALAVSYTNENNRTATFESIERWIGCNDKYADVPGVLQSRNANASDTHPQRHARLVSSLLSMARHGSTTGQVDADVQEALGILFNASDEFSKAVDCFSAAISVRPTDWLLYNRLGAVLSNSGRSEDALTYYRYALELKPDFARCHFNLAISCLNLQLHSEAARHCFIALSLQAADEAAQANKTAAAAGPSLDESNETGSAGSRSDNYSLWETLRVSLELQGKSQLAEKTRARDVSAFDIADFEVPGQQQLQQQQANDAQFEADWFAPEPSD